MGTQGTLDGHTGSIGVSRVQRSMIALNRRKDLTDNMKNFPQEYST